MIPGPFVWAGAAGRLHWQLPAVLRTAARRECSLGHRVRRNSLPALGLWSKGGGGTVCSVCGGVDEIVVRAPEALDRDSRTAFRRAALAEMEAAPAALAGRRIVVDLSRTSRVDSAGLGALIMLQQRASELRHTVCLRGASEELRFLLVLTRLEDRFEFEPPAA